MSQNLISFTLQLLLYIRNMYDKFQYIIHGQRFIIFKTNVTKLIISLILYDSQQHTIVQCSTSSLFIDLKKPPGGHMFSAYNEIVNYNNPKISRNE